MKPYIRQYDLPCYPDKVPSVGRRDIIGIAKGHVHNPEADGYYLWMGGCGLGHLTNDSLKEAEVKMFNNVLQRLERRADEAAARLVYAQLTGAMMGTTMTHPPTDAIRKRIVSAIDTATNTQEGR